MSRIRVAAHVHSEWSYDGRWSLEKVAATFGRFGYDAVLLAEHDRGFDAARWDAYRKACADASTETTLLVPGLEYSDRFNCVHVPVWGEVPFLGEKVPTGELLRRVQDVAGLAVLAHIGRRDAWRRVQPEWLDALFGLEVWNRKYDGYAPNGMAARLLLEQPTLVPFVSLDLHTARQLHPLAMVLDVDGAVTKRGIYDAMRRGHVSPIAFGLPALKLAHGMPLLAMSRLERARKGIAASARRAIHGPRLATRLGS